MAIKDWKKRSKANVLKEAAKMRLMSSRLAKLLGSGNYMVTTLKQYSQDLVKEWRQF